MAIDPPKSTTKMAYVRANPHLHPIPLNMRTGQANSHLERLRTDDPYEGPPQS